MITVEGALDDDVRYEDERGKPMPSLNHSVVQMRLGAQFLAFKNYLTCSELGLQLNSRPLTPDLSIYPSQRIDFRRDVVRRTDPPLLTVEIVSPGQGVDEIVEKIEHCLAAGVRSCWLVTPPLREVTIFTPDGAQQSFHSGVVTDPAIGVTADLDAVFS